MDCQKHFLDVAIGMPRSIHDSRMLCRSALFEQVEAGTMFDAEFHVEDFTPFLLGYVGYSLKQWLVTLYQDGPPQLGHRSVLECLFNKKLSRGRSVVKNAFGILK